MQDWQDAFSKEATCLATTTYTTRLSYKAGKIKHRKATSGIRIVPKICITQTGGRALRRVVIPLYPSSFLFSSSLSDLLSPKCQTWNPSAAKQWTWP